METDEWFSLTELTTRLGALVWVESQLSEVVGLWSRIDAHAPAAVHFAVISGHHGWHAETIRQCLPTSPALHAEQAVRSPTKGWEAAITSLASMTDPDVTATRLKVLVKVIDPWLHREIGALTDLARPVSDAAMQRWLRFVSIDHHGDGEAAASLLASRSSEAVRFEDHVLVNEIDLA